LTVFMLFSFISGWDLLVPLIDRYTTGGEPAMLRRSKHTMQIRPTRHHLALPDRCSCQR
jgi:hypothetical protein